MRRNVAALDSKARAHVVTPSLTLRAFLVTSGTSRQTYTVTPFGGGAVACSCKWGQHRPGDCSHVVAVRRFAARVLAERVVA